MLSRSLVLLGLRWSCWRFVNTIEYVKLSQNLVIFLDLRRFSCRFVNTTEYVKCSRNLVFFLSSRRSCWRLLNACCRQTWEKVNLNFNDDNDTVTFQQQKLFRFDPDQSVGDEDDMVVVPNIPMLVSTTVVVHTLSMLYRHPRFLKGLQLFKASYQCSLKLTM